MMECWEGQYSIIPVFRVWGHSISTRTANFRTGLRRYETAEAKAERIISEELARRGWKESDLLIHCKSDPTKLAIAARLRQETSLSVKTIADRMHLGTSKSANACLYGWMRHRKSRSS